MKISIPIRNINSIQMQRCRYFKLVTNFAAPMPLLRHLICIIHLSYDPKTLTASKPRDELHNTCCLSPSRHSWMRQAIVWWHANIWLHSYFEFFHPPAISTDLSDWLIVGPADQSDWLMLWHHVNKITLACSFFEEKNVLWLINGLSFCHFLLILRESVRICISSNWSHPPIWKYFCSLRIFPSLLLYII